MKTTIVVGVLIAVIAGFILYAIFLWPNYHLAVEAAVEANRRSKQEERGTQGPDTGTRTAPLGFFGSLPQEPEYRQPLDFLSLLGKPRREILAAAHSLLGKREEHPHDKGIELCFKDLGIHFSFDGDRLDKVIFYAELTDPGVAGDRHRSYTQQLPLGLHFGQDRQQAAEQVDNYEHKHVPALLGTGEWDDFEMKGYRLNLRFGESDGRQVLREVQLIRPKNEWARR